MAEKFTDLSHLAQDVSEMLNMYREKVLGAVADGVQEGAETFIKEVKKVSPPNDGPGIGGHYRDMWKIKPMRRAKYVRYVGNTKKVKAHVKDSEPSIPLINILEFSKDPKKYRPHVGKAVENSKDQIFDIIKSKVKEA